MYDDEIRDQLIEEIKRLQKEMEGCMPGSEEYNAMTEAMCKLFDRLKIIDDGYTDAAKEDAHARIEKRKDILGVTKVVLSAAGSIAAIGVIMVIENKSVILNSKVLNIATKLLPIAK